MHYTRIFLGILPFAVATSFGCSGEFIYLGNQAADGGLQPDANNVTTVDLALTQGSVAIYNDYKDLCRGILLSPHVVLTARHCVVDRVQNAMNDACVFPRIATANLPSSIRVRHLSKDGTTTEAIPVVDFAEPTQQTCNDDLIALELKYAANATDFPEVDSTTTQAPGNAVRTFGIGGPQLLNAQVRQTELTATPAGESDAFLYTRIPACAGDSGAPVMDANGRLIGIVAGTGADLRDLGREGCLADHDSLIHPLSKQQEFLARAVAKLENHPR